MSFFRHFLCVKYFTSAFFLVSEEELSVLFLLLDFNHISKYPHRVRHDDVALVLMELMAVKLWQPPIHQDFRVLARC